MKTMLKFQMLAAVCCALAVGAVSCSEETQITDELGTPDSEYKSDSKTVCIYGEIDPIAALGTSDSTVQTRAETNYDLYANPKYHFVNGDTVGFYSQGGNFADTREDGTTGPFHNIPMAYSRNTGTTSSFVSAPEAMDADVGNFGFKFIYWPYTKDMANPGMEVRDEDGYTKDVLFAMRTAEKDLKFNFKHAYTMFSITRGEGFENPKFVAENFTEEAKKAYDYATNHYNLPYMQGENAKYYMQVKLNYEIQYMSFPEDEKINGDPNSSYYGLTPLKFYADNTEKNWSIFDGFTSNGESTEIEGKRYPCYTVLVPATYSEFFRHYGSSETYYYKRLEIASISLFDNEGKWVTISDINLPKYDDATNFVGKLIRGGYRYPLTVAYTGLKPSIFPATVEKWTEEAWTDQRPAGVNQDNFKDFVNAYNAWNDNTTGRRPIDNDMKLQQIKKEMGTYANIKEIRENGTETLIGVELTIFLSEDIDASQYTSDFSGNSHYINTLYENDVFNGGGHTISDCHLTNASGSGFIGRLEGRLTQLNLSGFIINSTTTGATGVFCQTLGEKGKVENCRADGISISTSGPVGAVAGTRAVGSTVNGCTVRGYLEGTRCDQTDGSGEEFSGGTGDANNNFKGVYFQSK